jgi:hypothetical protein
MSLLQMSAGLRCALALGLAVALWVVVGWAMH